MEFRNEEKTSFRHLTPDQRSLIVEAWLKDKIEAWTGSYWSRLPVHINRLDDRHVYRIASDNKEDNPLITVGIMDDQWKIKYHPEDGSTIILVDALGNEFEFDMNKNEKEEVVFELLHSIMSETLANPKN